MIIESEWIATTIVCPANKPDGRNIYPTVYGDKPVTMTIRLSESANVLTNCAEVCEPA